MGRKKRDLSKISVEFKDSTVKMFIPADIYKNEGSEFYQQDMEKKILENGGTIIIHTGLWSNDQNHYILQWEVK